MNLARRAAMCGLSRWRTQHPPLRSVARALARCAARCPRCGATWCDLPQLGATWCDVATHAPTDSCGRCATRGGRFRSESGVDPRPRKHVRARPAATGRRFELDRAGDRPQESVGACLATGTRDRVATVHACMNGHRWSLAARGLVRDPDPGPDSWRCPWPGPVAPGMTWA